MVGPTPKPAMTDDRERNANGDRTTIPIRSSTPTSEWSASLLSSSQCSAFVDALQNTALGFRLSVSKTSATPFRRRMTMMMMLLVGVAAAWRPLYYWKMGNHNSKTAKPCPTVGGGSGAMRLPTEAEAGSVYVPGGGFAGFWYHLGYFSVRHSHNNKNGTTHTQSKSSSSNSNYYCYSSGCLSLVLAAYPVETVLQVANRIQASWSNGQLHRYQVVSTFLQDLLVLLNEPPTITTARVNHNDTTATITDLHQGHDSWNNVSKESQQQKHHQQQRQRQQLHWNSVLPRLRVLVTALTVVETASVQSDTSSSSWTLPLSSSRIQIQPLARTAASTHFADWIPFLEETMYIPWVTGPSTPLYDKSASPDSVLGLDGGFARWWHPPCDQTISVPLTVTTIFQAFNPGLKDTVALELYQRGVVDALAVDKEAMRPMSPIVKESPTGATTNEKSNNSRHNTRTSNRESRIISISDNDSHNDTPHRDRTNTTALFVGKPEIDDLKPQRFLDSWDVAMARFSVVVSS